MVFLAAYPGKAAAHALSDLRGALRTCREFPTPIGGGLWHNVRAVKGYAEGEDEVAFRADEQVVPDVPELPAEVHVIRLGTTLVTLVAKDVSGTLPTVRVPRDVEHRQIVALRKVAAA